MLKLLTTFLDYITQTTLFVMKETVSRVLDVCSEIVCIKERKNMCNNIREYREGSFKMMNAATKAWKTRRANAKKLAAKRSMAAKKAWATRRKNG